MTMGHAESLVKEWVKAGMKPAASGLTSEADVGTGDGDLPRLMAPLRLTSAKRR